MKRILIISPSEIATDPRVARHVSVALEFGEVFTCGYGPRPSSVSRHLEISPTSRYLTRSIINLTSIQFGAHKFAAGRTQFFREAQTMLMGSNFDAVIANDVHSLHTAFSLFDAGKIWADMHEYAPLESEHDWRWRLAYQRHVTRICRMYLARARSVSSVSRSICERYERDLSRSIQLIRNSSDFLQLESQSLDHSTPVLRGVHVGAAIRARRLEDLVLAVGDSEGEKSLDLYLIPTDKKYYDELVNLVERIPNVSIRPPVSQSELISAICKYDFGCVAIPPTSFNYANCLPNKFFQYIQARLPVMSGPIPEVAETIRTFDIGWVADGFSQDATKRCLATITPQDVRKIKQNLETAAQQLSSRADNDVRRRILSELLK